MKLLKKEINEIQRSIKELRYKLKDRELNFHLYIDDMIESLSFISGYSEKALEIDEE